MGNEDNQPKNGDKLLTIEDLAIYLGVKVRTLYNWRNLCKGPQAVRFGEGKRARTRYIRADVDQWLESQKRKA